jgi:Uma2 family endonuclease
MSVEEYRHAQFDGPDRDYVDGEVLERNIGELPHARIQAEVLRGLWEFAGTLGIQVLPEVRIQVAATRFRVADVAAWRRGPIGERLPAVPPFLIAEILSPEDRVVRLQPKIQDYLSYSVEWIWVIDPDERRALSYSPGVPGGTLVDVLRTNDPDVSIPLASVLAVLDR